MEEALLRVEETAPHDLIEVSRPGALERLRKELSDAIDHVVGIRVKVHLVAPKTIARSEGKAKRVVDRRNV